MGYDVIVVGGGSAGCVLSARLSEDPSRRVLLVEAGPDYGPDLPADIAAATAPTYSHDWGYMSSGKRPMPLPRARLIGGCGATNAAFALRGFPTDYARWGPGWSFEDVLSTFCHLETDLDFSDPWHGLDGPLPITRTWPEAWTPLQRAFLEAAATAGHSRVEDHNRPGTVGAGPGPRNVRGGMRVSTALAYLEPARHRPNLEILDETPVDVIAVDHGRAGAIGAGGRLIEADAIVLAAGTYGSPAILLRSGIGNADQLLGLGLDVKLPLSGVGQNLQDHPLAGVLLPCPREYSGGPLFHGIATWRSTLGDPTSSPDVFFAAGGPFPDPHSPTGAVAVVSYALLRPESRGSLRLQSADPSVPPLIDPGHLQCTRDQARMLDALREARRIAAQDPFARIACGAPLVPSSYVGDEDEEGLLAAVHSTLGTFHHPVGTCRMGDDPAEGAVVDGRGRVHGIKGLFVADASVMPYIPSAPVHLPTIMLAERVAGWLAAS